ncbi:MAG: ATP-binding protein [Rubrivivax sp.]
MSGFEPQLHLLVQLEQERAARADAEARLEQTARELYDTNVLLQSLIVELDTVVAARTAEALAARDEAVAASQAKTAFLANMSHEIRTPLASIIGFAELLLEQRQEVGRDEALHTIAHNGRHLLQVISDILDVSKIEAGSLEVEPGEANLAALLHETEDLVSPQVREKGLQFDLQVQLPLPLRVRADHLRLKQVLLNFTSNAAKFTAAGGVTLRACAANGWLQLSVTDTGIGLDAAQCARLFQPFAQADVSTTRRFGGTGLGLYICKRLAELMGGDVHVRSEPGRGSCFTLQLPVGDGDGPWIDELHEWDRAGRAAAPARVTVPSLQGHVLLAEDGVHNQRLIRALVQATGATMDVVDNGESAVQAALEGAHDLVLMDIQMPRLDGVAAVQLLRGAGHGGPVVALTANVMRSDIETYRAAGCDDVLAKPIDRARLYQVLSRHLRRSAAPVAADDGRLDAVMRRLADSFRNDWPAQCAELRAAVERRDLPALRTLAHRIKGLAGSIGFDHLTALAAPVQRALDEGRADEALTLTDMLLTAPLDPEANA